MSAERERRAIKLLILREVLRRHFGIDDIRFDEQPDAEPSEIAGLSPFPAPAMNEFLVDALGLLRLRLVHRPGEAVVQIRLDQVKGAEVMVARLPDQSPRALLDTVTAADEAYHGRDMVELIRVGDIESYDRCLRQIDGDGFT